MLRMGSMIVMLAVIFMLIVRSSDPQTWVWLTGDESAVQLEEKKTAKLAKKVEPVVDAKPVIEPGPTDEDEEEQAAAIEEFQALSDRSLKLGPEEMPSYWRTFGWVQHQSFGQLQKRSTKDVPMHDFMHDTDEQRGRLVSFDLNVRRILAYDAPKNSVGVKKVYEIWGFTTESKAWLYCVLTPHLPPGMPIGPDVYEKVKFSGYFLKLQGYEAAGAGPNDKPLAAPLLIGRVAWQRSALASDRKTSSGSSWWMWLGGIAAVFFLGRILFTFFNFSRGGLSADRSQVVRTSTEPAEVQQWLERAEDGDKSAGDGGIDIVSGSSQDGQQRRTHELN